MFSSIKMKKSNQSEEVLNWKNEAEAIIRDVGDHVKYIGVSKKLNNSSLEIFMNLKTLENDKFCIRASGDGFRIVAEEFDKVVEKELNEEDEDDIFETPYALLNKISSSYVESFAKQLVKKLQNLEDELE